MSLLATIGSAFASGGITGLLGAGITGFVEYKKQRLLLEHEAVKMNHEADMAELNMEADRQRSEFKLKGIEVKTKAELDIAESKSFDKSHESDRATYSKPSDNGWLIAVDFFRGMIRPVTTVFFIYLLWSILGDTTKLMVDKDVTATEAKDLYQTVIWVVLYLATTVTLWWYGTRNKVMKPGLLKLEDMKK